MTPEQVALLIRAVEGEADRIMVWTLVLVVIGAGLASYFGSYLQSKGSQRALKEDVKALTAQVSATTKAAEEIKASIGSAAWVQQRRWELKRDLYTDLLRAVYRLVHTSRNILDLYILEDQLGAPMYKDYLTNVQSKRATQEARLEPIWEDIIRVRGFGELTLRSETIAILDTLHKSWNAEQDPNLMHVDILEDRIAIAGKAHEALVQSAKTDMEL